MYLVEVPGIAWIIVQPGTLGLRKNILHVVDRLELKIENCECLH